MHARLPASKHGRFLSHFLHRSQFSHRPPKPPVFRPNAARSSPEPLSRCEWLYFTIAYFIPISVQILHGKSNLIRYCQVEPQWLLFSLFNPLALSHSQTGARKRGANCSPTRANRREPQSRPRADSVYNALALRAANFLIVSASVSRRTNCKREECRTQLQHRQPRRRRRPTSRPRPARRRRPAAPARLPRSRPTIPSTARWCTRRWRRSRSEAARRARPCSSTSCSTSRSAATRASSTGTSRSRYAPASRTTA